MAIQLPRPGMQNQSRFAGEGLATSESMAKVKKPDKTRLGMAVFDRDYFVIDFPADASGILISMLVLNDLAIVLNQRDAVIEVDCPTYELRRAAQMRNWREQTLGLHL